MRLAWNLQSEIGRLKISNREQNIEFLHSLGPLGISHVMNYLVDISDIFKFLLLGGRGRGAGRFSTENPRREGEVLPREGGGRGAGRVCAGIWGGGAFFSRPKCPPRLVGSVFGRTLCGFLFLGRRSFSLFFSPDFFLSFLWEKVPRKILQEIPPAKSFNIYTTKIPDTFLQRGQAKDFPSPQNVCSQFLEGQRHTSN